MKLKKYVSKFKEQAGGLKRKELIQRLVSELGLNYDDVDITEPKTGTLKVCLVTQEAVKNKKQIDSLCNDFGRRNLILVDVVASNRILGNRKYKNRK